MVDYLIVGGGFAGYFFAHQLVKNNKTFYLYDVEERSASRVSAGIVNPVVLKKFTTIWLAMEQITALRQTLDEMLTYLGENFWIDEPVYRLFHDADEKKLWLEKSLEEDLKTFLSSDIHFLEQVSNPEGAGKVEKSGRINVERFFQCFSRYLTPHGMLKQEFFDYDQLDADNKSYQGLHYKHVIFCEGMNVKDNKFFSFIPVVPNKGHQLNVRITDFSIAHTVKKKHFLFPLNEKDYYYGGTYDRNFTDENMDPAAVSKLDEGLKQIITMPYGILKVRTGFRPTVADRRPILGAHPSHSDLFVFNGLGARGILNGNFFAKELFDHIENKHPLRPEVDLKRFL